MDTNEPKEETAGIKSQEYYWEQEKQLFAIHRFFYEHSLLPKGDSYFPDDVIKTVESLQARIKELERLLEMVLRTKQLVLPKGFVKEECRDEVAALYKMYVEITQALRVKENKDKRGEEGE